MEQKNAIGHTNKVRPWSTVSDSTPLCTESILLANCALMSIIPTRVNGKESLSFFSQFHSRFNTGISMIIVY